MLCPQGCAAAVGSEVTSQGEAAVSVLPAPFLLLVLQGPVACTEATGSWT